MSEEKPHNHYRGRLAPISSEFLHLGHVRTFSSAWERARAVNGQLAFRMDDLILPAVPKNMPKHVDDIKGMGLDWDEGPDKGGNLAHTNKVRSRLYLETLSKLHKLGCIYPCIKSLKDIRDAGLMGAQAKNIYIRELPI